MVVVLNYPIEINGEHPLPSVGEEKTLIYHSSTGDHQIHFRNLIYFGKSMAGGESFYVYEVKEIE
jgi:hypothetical protein